MQAKARVEKKQPSAEICGSNVTDIRLVDSAHPTADQGFQQFAEVDFSLIQWHSSADLGICITSSG